MRLIAVKMQVCGKIGADPVDIVLVRADDVEVASGHTLRSTNHQLDALSDEWPTDETDLDGSGASWPGDQIGARSGFGGAVRSNDDRLACKALEVFTILVGQSSM